MDTARAAATLGALAQESQLSMFRTLARAWPAGLSADDVRQRLGLSSTALARHMTELVDAGLVVPDYHDEVPCYVASIEGLRGLIAHLSEECCDGRPERAGIMLVSPQVSPSRRKGVPPTQSPSETEIERRVFHYRHYGAVTAYRVRFTPGSTPAYGSPAFSATPLLGVHMKAEWGQTIAVTPKAKTLGEMTDEELVALCDSVFFRPAAG